MRLDAALLEDIRKTIASGYYERCAPPRREKKSLAEAMEKTHTSGQLPLLVELALALPEKGLLAPNRQWLEERIGQLAAANPTALSLWVEPRFHGGELRWLAAERSMPLLCKDWIIDARQIVGGDAVLLKRSLIEFAHADEHALIEAAHEQDIEVVLEVRTPEQLQSAKASEADVIAINNHGANGHPATINTTVQMLAAQKTGRPILSMHGIHSGADVRTLIMAGATGVELGAEFAREADAPARIIAMRRAVMGKDPVVA